MTGLIFTLTLCPVMGLRTELRLRQITYGELGRRVHKHEQTIAKYVRGALPIPPDVARLISLSTGIPLSSILPEREEVKAT